MNLTPATYVFTLFSSHPRYCICSYNQESTTVVSYVCRPPPESDDHRREMNRWGGNKRKQEADTKVPQTWAGGFSVSELQWITVLCTVIHAEAQRTHTRAGNVTNKELETWAGIWFRGTSRTGSCSTHTYVTVVLRDVSSPHAGPPAASRSPLNYLLICFKKKKHVDSRSNRCNEHEDDVCFTPSFN